MLIAPRACRGDEQSASGAEQVDRPTVGGDFVCFGAAHGQKSFVRHDIELNIFHYDVAVESLDERVAHRTWDDQEQTLRRLAQNPDVAQYTALEREYEGVARLRWLDVANVLSHLALEPAFRIVAFDGDQAVCVKFDDRGRCRGPCSGGFVHGVWYFAFHSVYGMPYRSARVSS